MDSPARDSTSATSAASPSTPLRTPFGASAAPMYGLSRLSSSRAARCVPKAQPEDFASPLQSGLRFGVMSQVSPDVGSAIGPSDVSEQVAVPPSHPRSQVVMCTILLWCIASNWTSGM